MTRDEILREHHRREGEAFVAVISVLRGTTLAAAARQLDVTPERVRQRLFAFRRKVLHSARIDKRLASVSCDMTLAEFRANASIWIPAFVKYARERGHQLPEDKT